MDQKQNRGYLLFIVLMVHHFMEEGSAQCLYLCNKIIFFIKYNENSKRILEKYSFLV